MLVARIADEMVKVGKIAEHDVVVMRLGMQKGGLADRPDTLLQLFDDATPRRFGEGGGGFAGLLEKLAGEMVDLKIIPRELKKRLVPGEREGNYDIIFLLRRKVFRPREILKAPLRQ